MHKDVDKSTRYHELQKLRYDIVQNAIALLDLVDTNENSKTYGCCHKPFWRKEPDATLPVIPDFINARWQEAGLTLAMLWNKQYHSLNLYFKDDNLKRIIKAILSYWIKIQHKDGSFDEWKKYEHGQPPTAFSTYAMIRALEIMKTELNRNEISKIKKSIKKATDWLCVNSEPIGINHEVVAVNTLYNAYLIFRDQKYLQAIDEKFEIIEERFSEEGWFNEVGGPDTGYNEVSLTYLGLYWRASNDKRVLPIANKVINLNKYFVYPDYISGGGINTRYATSTLPLGYAIFYDEFPPARELLLASIKSISNKTLKGVYNSTDYQRCDSLYLYLMLFDILENIDLQYSYKRLPAFDTESFIKIFDDAKIAVIKTPHYYLTIGKGGAIGSLFIYDSNCTTLYSSPKNLINVSGVFIELNNQEFLTNMYRENEVSLKRYDNSIEAKTQMYPVNMNRDTIWGVKNTKDKKVYLMHLMGQILPLKISSKLRSRMVDLYHDYLNRKQIRKRKEISSVFERTITLWENFIQISNKISISNHISPNAYIIEPFAINPKHINKYKLLINKIRQYDLDPKMNIEIDNANNLCLLYNDMPIISIDLKTTWNCRFILSNNIEDNNNSNANRIALLCLIDATAAIKNNYEIEYEISGGVT